MSKTFMTPIGLSGYSNLTKPDTKFDPNGVYKTSVRVPEEKAEAIIEQAKEVALDELGPKKAAKAKFPIDENDDGTVTIRLKTRKAPKLFDAIGNQIKDPDLIVGGGSKIRAKGSMKAYENGANIGVSFYLNEVQIIDLRSAGGFDPVDDEDGVFIYGDPSPSNLRVDSGGAEAEPEQEDVEF